MVQAAPNESTVVGFLHEIGPDPERPGFLVVEIELEDSVRRPRDVPPELPAGGDDEPNRVRAFARAQELTEGIDGERVRATLRMVGPGEFRASRIEPAPVRGSRRGHPSPSPGARRSAATEQDPGE